MRVKILSCLLAILLAAYIPISVPAGQTTMSMMGYEALENNRAWADHLFFKRMADRTGLHFSFDQYGDLAKYRGRLAEMTSAGPDLPDVLFKARLTPAITIQMHEAGVLVDLKPYLEQYAPNFTALMAENPEIRKAITLPGGAIPALPFISLPPPQNALWVNQAWLDILGISMPRSVEGLYDMLSAFQTLDPNGNGRRDEIPLSFLGPYDLKYLAHAWGLIANDYNLFVRDGQVVFMPLQAEFRPFLSWLRGLWVDRLLARDGFTTHDNLRRQTDAKADNRFGAFFAPLPANLVPFEWAGDYRVMAPIPYEGQEVYRAVSGPVFTGAFAVTSACNDIGAALSWVDVLYTPDGAVLAGIGVEGEDYVLNGDGSWQLLHQSADQGYLTKSVITTDYSAPGISADAFERKYSDPLVGMLASEVDSLARSNVSAFPPFSLTWEEEAAVAPMQAAIGRFVDESLVRFVTGEWEMSDERFAAFSKTLESLGLPEFLDFWQNIYDRGQ